MVGRSLERVVDGSYHGPAVDPAEMLFQNGFPHDTLAATAVWAGGVPAAGMRPRTER